MNDDARIAELTQKMLRKKLYVLLSKPSVAAGEAQAVSAGASRIHDRPGKARRRVRVRAAGRRRGAAERPWLDRPAGGDRAGSARHRRGRSVLRQRIADFRAQGMDGHGRLAWDCGSISRIKQSKLHKKNAQRNVHGDHRLCRSRQDRPADLREPDQERPPRRRLSAQLARRIRKDRRRAGAFAGRGRRAGRHRVLLPALVRSARRCGARRARA